MDDKPSISAASGNSCDPTDNMQELNNQLELQNRLLNETFGRYLSDEIVRQILNNPGGLELGGVKKTLTIMQSDLRGFTAMAERMPADRLITMLNYYIGKMTECISRHHGTIIDFIGDGIMVIFGAPRHSDNHAADAIAAAIDMECHMDEVNAWNEANGFPEFKMGIGISTGEVVVGNIGCERHMKYGVVGSSVNLAGRIESYAVGGQVLISEATKEQAGIDLEIVNSLTVSPKGLSRQITLYDVTGIGGDYCLFCDTRRETPTPLTKPRSFTYRFIDYKHVENEIHHGECTALSTQGAVITTDVGLSAFENIVINAALSKPLYAKVLRPEQDGWYISFTSVPEDIGELIE